MKTHEFAEALASLATSLKRGPNLDIGVAFQRLRGTPSGDEPASIAVNLTTLVQLSNIGKAKWVEFIHAYQLPITIRPRDASRDILGKLLRLLEEDPELRQRVVQGATTQPRKTSPELTRALTFLLGGEER